MPHGAGLPSLILPHPHQLEQNAIRTGRASVIGLDLRRRIAEIVFGIDTLLKRRSEDPTRAHAFARSTPFAASLQLCIRDVVFNLRIHQQHVVLHDICVPAIVIHFLLYIPAQEHTLLDIKGM